MSRTLAAVALLPALLLGCEGDEAESTPSADAAASELDASPPSADAELPPMEWSCTYEGGEVHSLAQLGCFGDFEALASAPLDSTIPGARSLKTVIDRIDDTLYFQNTNLYPIHHDFTSERLSGMGLPIVPMLAEFNATEYTAPSRRFLLGTITWYEGAQKFCYEIAPYDAATPGMVEQAYRAIAANSYFGDELYFHPSSASVEAVAALLPEDVKVITTDELFAGVDYQPLNPATAYGQLRFVDEAALEDTYVGFRDIVVLQSVPNDISVVSGIITEAFQTPLSHINVLSKNRGTPNMALRGAFSNEALRALDGKWVRLEVNAIEYIVEEVDRATADAWWEENKPAEVQLPGVDKDTDAIAAIEDIVDTSGDDLKAAIKVGTRAYGGKAAHYSVLARIEDVPVPKAIGIPVHYYFQFMEQHGFDEQIAAMLADPEFQEDAAVRDTRLDELRDAMKEAPLDADFEATIIERVRADFPGLRVRFRSSTNAEDLDGFTGAGLYVSKSGDPDDPDRPVADAIRKVWASVWFFRAFEERSYRSIDHESVGMALLVHRSFPDEEANGVALTNNPFDTSGLEPAFYINVQAGELSVVLPDPGVQPDSFLYYFDRPDQPITFISHSTEVSEGETVLTESQTFELGSALAKVRETFARAYATDGWWALDVEFKFDGEPGEEPQLFVKQARPFQ